MLLTGATVVLYGFIKKPKKREIIIWIGLGLAERSHVFEYSVLAVFIHQAMMEHYRTHDLILKPTIMGFILALIIGIADEYIQKFIPERIFDPQDILFNILAVTMAISGSMLIFWIRKTKNN